MKEGIDFGFNENGLLVIPEPDNIDATDSECERCACEHLSPICIKMHCAFMDRPDRVNIHWVVPENINSLWDYVYKHVKIVKVEE